MSDEHRYADFDRDALLNILSETEKLSNVGGWEWEIETDTVTWSEELYRIFQLDPDGEAPNWAEHPKLLHPEDSEKLRQAAEKAIADGKPYEIELRAIRKDGKTRICKSKGFAQIGTDGQVIKLFGLLQDITDKKLVENALRESENEFRNLFESTPIATFVWGCKGSEIILRDINSTAILMTHGKGEQFIGCSIDQIYPDRPDMLYNFKVCLTGKKNIVYETEYVSRGTDLERFIVFTFVYISDELLMLHADDVTERKQAEKLLVKKEALFRGLFDHMTSGSAVYEVRNDGSKGTDYIIREFNRKSLEMEGKKTEEVMGRSLFDLRPNIDDYGLIPAMKKVWETGISMYFPTKIYQDEKFSNYYENHIFKLPSGEVVTIYNDVTEQKNQENALQDSEQMYRTTFDAIPDSITVTRQKDGRYNYVNDGFCNITGYSRAEVIGKTPFEINLYVNPSDRERMVQTLRKNQELLNFEILFRRKNGTIFDSFFSARPVVIDGEDCLIALAKDVTEFKRAEEEKAKLETQLTQAQKMESVGRLAGGVAHDFNNMLGVILGHVGFALEKAEGNHDLYDDLNEIQKAAQRSANLTKQLLTFARKDIISPKRINLNDTVESMLNMLRRLIGEDIDLVWQPGAHLWPVKMDPTQIDQILANLCINARDAISGVGKLTIETGSKTFDKEYCNEHPGFIPGDFVLLAVSDNGCGMDKETLDNLFEPFFTTKEVGKGTGLGLATVYGIVKQNNGFIKVYSEPGHGSTFKIHIPRFFSDEGTDVAVPEKEAAAGGTETILLVEDEPSILRMTRMMLERKGYTVLSAATPAESIAMAKTYGDKIHLLMTDVVMPEMNGRDLAKQITALYPCTRLLFMSGYTSNVIAHQGILDDGVAFIQKPFSMADMTEKVRGVLDTAPDQG